MEAYGTMAFDRMHADALTISPYMGCDVIEPLIKWLQQGCGIYAVYLSSNPSGYKIQKTKVIDRDTVVADLMIEPMIELLKQKNLSQSLGLVIGVNYFEELPEIINKYTDSFSFLIPGIGAQGGSISTTLQSTIHDNSPHLYTISRDLTGLGSTTLQEPLRKIRNIDEYCSFLERRIAIYNT
jgi:orotidine-5'-phosphate decarboxylase